MLLYITSRENYNLLDDICEKNNIVISKVTDHANLKRFVMQEMNNLSHCTQFAIDLLALRNTDDEIIQAIQAFRTMYDSRIIIVSLNDGSNELLEKLQNDGVYYFIAEIHKDNLKEHIKECIIGEDKRILPKAESDILKTDDISTKSRYEEQAIGTKYKPPVESNLIKESLEDRQIIKEDKPQTFVKEKIVIKEKPKFVKQKSIIAVCGTQNRIGTTTQSILITKFLNSQGLKSCYVEANGNNHIITIPDYYTVNVNKDIGIVQTDNIEMYYKYDLPYIMSLNYDFYILDYGRFENVDTESFIIADKRVIVAGAKAWEMDKFSNIFRKVGTLNDINFIFSFVYINEQEDIKELMSKFKYTTYFSAYIPTHFIESPCDNESIYKSIFKDYLEVEVNQECIKTPKRKWFGVFKK